MLKWTLLILASSVLAAPAHPLPAAFSQRRAVVVGIERYVTDAPPVAAMPRRLSNAPGARADAEGIATLLEDVYGFDVKLLRDAEAKRAAILEAIDQHLLSLKGGASAEAVFFFAGHGSQVLNSASKEKDHYDETLVPADAAGGIPDIRDKELRRIFNKILARGVKLTIILDACHSGSGVRGLRLRDDARAVDNMPGDVADRTDPGLPLERSALVLAAAQEHELAYSTVDGAGKSRGAFTFSLLRALSAAPCESASRVLLRARSWLAAEGFAQQPFFDGPEDRRNAPLFGSRKKNSSRPSASVVGVEEDGTVLLMGGWGTGLGEGSELKAVALTRKDRLRILEAGLTRSRARWLPRRGEELPSYPIGELFELERWMVAEEPRLRVLIPSIHLSPQALDELATKAWKETVAAGLAWVDDPKAQTPSHVLSWTGDSWKLADLASPLGGTSRELGPELLPAALVAALPHQAQLFVQWPVPASLEGALELGAGRLNSAIARVDLASEAHYVLVGRFRNEALEYSWIRPDPGANTSSPLPVGTAWVKLTADQANGADALTAAALALGRIRGWLTLDSPDPFYFPYRLLLVDAENGEVKAGEQGTESKPESAGELRGGHSYRVHLQASRAEASSPVEPRYVYVFFIDQEGKSTLLYPHPPCELTNHLPPPAGADGLHPTDISLCPGVKVRVHEPWGVDTYFLLVTSEVIPDPWVLDFEKVKGSDAKSTDPLSALLESRHSTFRGPDLLVFPTWMVRRVQFHASAPREGQR